MKTSLHPTTLQFALVFCSPVLLHAQILTNGDFQTGAEGWGLSQQEMARAEFTTVDSDSPAGGKAGRIGARASPAIREVSTQGGEKTHSSPKLGITIPALDMLLLEVTGGW